MSRLRGWGKGGSVDLGLAMKKTITVTYRETGLAPWAEKSVETSMGSHPGDDPGGLGRLGKNGVPAEMASSSARQVFARGRTTGMHAFRPSAARTALKAVSVRFSRRQGRESPGSD